jgi:hypothetical protein
MAFKTIGETETALTSHLGINLERMSLKDNIGTTPFIALLGVEKIGAKPACTFGVFVPIKALDKDIQKVYPTIDGVINSLLDIHTVYEFSFEKAELKQYEGGMLNYCISIKTKQR